jgi:hypothetical protein
VVVGVEGTVGVDEGGRLRVVPWVTDVDVVDEVLEADDVVDMAERVVGGRTGDELEVVVAVVVEGMPTVTVETTVLRGALETVEGMGIADVAPGSGVENEPCIWSRLQKKKRVRDRVDRRRCGHT